MSMKNVMNHFMAGMVLIASFIFIAGCDVDIADYCANWAECENGNKADAKACVDEKKAEWKVAKIYGCETQLQDLTACEVDKSVCLEVTYPPLESAVDSSDTSLSDSPTYYYTDDQKCLSEDDAYNTCMNPGIAD
jgi:hypothetical protein